MSGEDDKWNLFVLQEKSVVPLQFSAEGKVRYDSIARMGQRKDKVVHTSLVAMSQQNRPAMDPELVKPSDEEVEKVRISVEVC